MMAFKWWFLEAYELNSPVLCDDTKPAEVTTLSVILVMRNVANLVACLDHGKLESWECVEFVH